MVENIGEIGVGKWGIMGVRVRVSEGKGKEIEGGMRGWDGVED